jgi:hypothetical protein
MNLTHSIKNNISPQDGSVYDIENKLSYECHNQLDPLLISRLYWKLDNQLYFTLINQLYWQLRNDS